MADINILGKIQVDAGQSAKSISDLKKEINESKKALENAKIGTKEYEQAQDKLSKSQKELTESTKTQTGTFGKLKESLGGIIPGFNGAAEGASGLGKQLLLLAVNPIVAVFALIVGALVLMYQGFKNTFEGGEKLEQLFEGISASLQVLKDRFLSIGGAMVKLFSGDVKGAITDVKSAVTGIGEEIQNVYEKTALITKRLQELKIAQRADDVDKSVREKRLALLREQLNDESVSIQDRKNIALELRKDQQANAVDDYNRTKEITELKIKLLSQQKDGVKKNADEISKLQIDLNNVQTENALEMVRTNKVIRNLDHQEQARINEIDNQNKETEKLKKEKLKADNEAYFAKIVKDGKDAVLELDGINASLKTLDDADKAKKEKERADDVAAKVAEGKSLQAQVEFKKKLGEAEVATRLAQQAEINASLTNSIEIFGRTSIAGKALAISQALINTYLGATSVLSSKSTLPSPFDFIAKAVNVAAVLASGFKSIKAITAVQIPGGGGGATPRLESGGVSAPVLPQQSSTSLNAASIQGVGNAAAGGVNGRNFVLDVDISNNQERAARLQRAARLD